MSKTYLPCDPDQQLLLLTALQEWLPEDHLACFIFDVVDQLDLSEITARYEGERRGGLPYNPRMMVKVLLYAYCVGVPSSRRMATRLHEDIAFRVLAANNTPDFRTISDFRKDHLVALSGLFLRVLMLCSQGGLVTPNPQPTERMSAAPWWGDENVLLASGIMVFDTENRPETRSTHRMLPRNDPDRIHIAFDDHRLVANAGLMLPVTLAHHLGLGQLVDRHVDLGGAPGRANVGDPPMAD